MWQDNSRDVSFFEAHRCEDYTRNRVCAVCGAAEVDPNCAHAELVPTGLDTAELILMKCVDCGVIDWVAKA